jgi:NAD(P)-dependent dehydrogenase (short-subunit alcohol dehydrogenase family)
MANLTPSNAFNPDGSKFGELRDKVVVLTGKLRFALPRFLRMSLEHVSKCISCIGSPLEYQDEAVFLHPTGGANGIGAATVSLLHSHGAKIVFGDYDAKAGEALASRLGEDVTFLKTDVSKYADNLALFKTAFQKYGRIDHAVAVAGVGEKGDWFKDDLTVEDVETPQDEGTVQVNTLGVLYFVRIALPYLRLGRTAGEDRSLVIVGSAAGFRPSPGLPVYAATKHSIQGLLRSLRSSLHDAHNIRLNVLNPGVTDTQMAGVVARAFRAAGLEDAVNMPEELAVTILGFLTEREIWGRSVYVEGGKGWEFEGRYWEMMPQWLGEGPTERLRRGLELVASVSAFFVLVYGA